MSGDLLCSVCRLPTPVVDEPPPERPLRALELNTCLLDHGPAAHRWTFTVDWDRLVAPRLTRFIQAVTS